MAMESLQNLLFLAKLDRLLLRTLLVVPFTPAYQKRDCCQKAVFGRLPSTNLFQPASRRGLRFVSDRGYQHYLFQQSEHFGTSSLRLISGRREYQTFSSGQGEVAEPEPNLHRWMQEIGNVFTEEMLELPLFAKDFA